jgi:hypothetical protein
VCTVDSPQAKTNTTEYATASGSVKLLSKTRRKEYLMKTGFYSEYMHDAIKEMLMHPDLSILIGGNENGVFVPVYESGDYDVDWSNKDENDFAPAETRLSEQETDKYFNC